MVSLFTKHKLLFVAVPVVVVALTYYHYANKPRVLTVGEVPIAFWSWRTQMPTTDEVRQTFTSTGAKILFQRAGQFDLSDGKVRRIRPANGKFPTGIETHLVYNSTRRFMRDLEKLDANQVAVSIAQTFREDSERAIADGAEIVGVQLDLDFPTRLLPEYAELLRSLRYVLPRDTQLSITGLPTWASSLDFEAVLAEVDFWTPQLYGAAIPSNVDDQIPISSAKEVKAAVQRIRDLNKPFYAGLAAYGYVILYGKDGSIVEVRGDIDPHKAELNSDLELIERSTFSSGEEKRLVYRARSDHVFRGLTIRAGEMLVFDIPSVQSLEAAALAVREDAGERILGICIFRLPSRYDKTTLSIADVAAALDSD